MMENLLLKKLQVKPGFKVLALNAPENFLAIIGELPNDIEVSMDESIAFNALFIFATTKVEMLTALATKHQSIGDQTICWIMYPKAKSKLASDLNLMQSWEDLNRYQLAPCASAAIDQTWTALRIKPVDSTKRSGMGNAEIQQNEYGEFVDVKRKIVNLPDDLKTVLEKNSTALDFYEQLSYSNRKEYVLWVLSAKQEKTRLDRIQKTVDKLTAKKKNPTEK